MPENALQIATLDRGAIVNQADLLLQEIAENISSPNAPAKAPRKLVIELVFKPNDNRDTVAMTYKVKSVLPPMNPGETTILVEEDARGKVTATELARGQKADQLTLTDETNVINFPTAKEGK